MLFCLKPSEQVQYLQLSLKTKTMLSPALCCMGLLGVREVLAFAAEASASIHTPEVVLRKANTGTWQR